MTNSATRKFLTGELVQVRSAGEILATLDERGDLDGLPFMPEMLTYCGARFRVLARAHKTCDTSIADEWCLRSMERTVHLAELRCSGDAHGDCQARCLLYWKEEWLEPVEDESREDTSATDQSSVVSPNDQADMSARDALMPSTRPNGQGESSYRCQTTQIFAVGRRLPWWEPTQYAKDFWYNGVSPLRLVKGLCFTVFNGIQRRIGGQTRPCAVGELRRTPSEHLDLQPGEYVEVKQHKEILATLDLNGRNRGMSFGSELVPYCGSRYRVLQRVERMIEEPTGKMIELPNPAIILEDVVCNAHYHRFCPRRTYPYWREIWLRRVPSPESARSTNESPQCNDLS